MLVTDIIPSIVYGAVLLFMLGAIAALWSRMGIILRDIGRLDADVAGNRTALNEKTDSLQTALNEKTDALQTSLNEKTNALNVKTDTLQTSLNELKNTFAEMQLQMQRNHYQMMMAILSHSHRPDGRPTFDLPPDFEPAPAEE